ncbi:TPA: helix-turn-helix domain-containing protein [Aeromonas veronii]|uniref:helix-turn-helix domain-containing protein n=1 Tax=Aeromonas TaxID=642 RepID=UPI0022E0D5CD|nr:transcriptional regulator [Aeromonas sp. Y293-4]
MNIIPVRDAASHAAAIARIEAIFDAAPGTPEFDELDVLATLVESYEDKAFPMPDPDPIEAINFRLEQMGLEQKDLVTYLGQSSRVTEVLKRQRGLSLNMIRRLTAGLGIPAEILIRPYPLK